MTLLLMSDSRVRQPQETRRPRPQTRGHAKPKGDRIHPGGRKVSNRVLCPGNWPHGRVAAEAVGSICGGCSREPPKGRVTVWSPGRRAGPGPPAEPPAFGVPPVEFRSGPTAPREDGSGSSDRRCRAFKLEEGRWWLCGFVTSKSATGHMMDPRFLQARMPLRPFPALRLFPQPSGDELEQGEFGPGTTLVRRRQPRPGQPTSVATSCHRTTQRFCLILGTCEGGLPSGPPTKVRSGQC